MDFYYQNKNLKIRKIIFISCSRLSSGATFNAVACHRSVKGLSHTFPDGLSGFGDYCRPIKPACRNKPKQPIPCPKQNVCDKRNNML